MGMKVNIFRTSILIGAMAVALPLVQKWEGLSLNAYLDPVRIPTICYGHILDVKIGDSASKEECELILTYEMVEYMVEVDKVVIPDMPDTRLAALTSFSYNVGITAFKNSTLLKLLNEGKTAQACEQLSLWVYAKGKKLNGLVKRREEEKQLCLYGLKEN